MSQRVRCVALRAVANEHGGASGRAVAHGRDRECALAQAIGDRLRESVACPRTSDFDRGSLRFDLRVVKERGGEVADLGAIGDQVEAVGSAGRLKLAMRIRAAARVEHFAPDGVAVDACAELRQWEDVGGIEVRLDRASDAVDEPGQAANEIAFGHAAPQGGEDQLLALGAAVVVRVMPRAGEP